jgi:hypothetical protein
MAVMVWVITESACNGSAAIADISLTRSALSLQTLQHSLSYCNIFTNKKVCALTMLEHLFDL